MASSDYEKQFVSKNKVKSYYAHKRCAKTRVSFSLSICYHLSIRADKRIRQVVQVCTPNQLIKLILEIPRELLLFSFLLCFIRKTRSDNTIKTWTAAGRNNKKQSKAVSSMQALNSILNIRPQFANYMKWLCALYFLYWLKINYPTSGAPKRQNAQQKLFHDPVSMERIFHLHCLPSHFA